MVEKKDPDNFTRFQTRERCALEIAAYVFNYFIRSSTGWNTEQYWNKYDSFENIKDSAMFICKKTCLICNDSVQNVKTLVWKISLDYFCVYWIESKHFGLSCDLFKGTPPKWGLVYAGLRRNSAKWPNGILICSADQRKKRVTQYYNCFVLLKKFVHEKCLSNNVRVMLNNYVLLYIYIYFLSCCC